MDLLLVNTGGASCNGMLEVGDLSLEHLGDLLGHQVREPELMVRPQGRTFAPRHSFGHFCGGGEALICTGNVMPLFHVYQDS